MQIIRQEEVGWIMEIHPKENFLPREVFFFLREWGWEMYWGRQFLSKEEVVEQEWGKSANWRGWLSS